MQMTEQTLWESFKAERDNFVEKLRALIHEGNVRRVIVQHGGRTIAEFPLTAGVVGAVLAPVVAAIGAIVALLKDCSIQVERTESSPKQTQRDRAAS
jgi:hypothetical protein